MKYWVKFEEGKRTLVGLADLIKHPQFSMKIIVCPQYKNPDNQGNWFAAQTFKKITTAIDDTAKKKVEASPKILPMRTKPPVIQRRIKQGPLDKLLNFADSPPSWLVGLACGLLVGLIAYPAFSAVRNPTGHGWSFGLFSLTLIPVFLEAVWLGFVFRK